MKASALVAIGDEGQSMSRLEAELAEDLGRHGRRLGTDVLLGASVIVISLIRPSRLPRRSHEAAAGPSLGEIGVRRDPLAKPAEASGNRPSKSVGEGTGVPADR